MIEKVVSGGQSGADIGGLLIAESRGLATGGWMPKGWKTEDGPKPEYGDRFGMEEHPDEGYPARTHANARDSDGTVRFASNFGTAGERCTLKGIQKHDKPHFDVKRSDPPDPKEMADWIRANNIKVLNVAGNRESTSYGMSKFVQNYLGQVLDELAQTD